jgi:O-succinylbenzoic acid--CoA ligase
VPGELVAVDMPRGPAWFDVVVHLWNSGVAILPLDDRLSAAEHRRIVELARPTWVLHESGAEVFAGAPVEPGVAAIVATSGAGGAPKLAELSREAMVAAVTASASALGVATSDPWVACLSPAHIGGLLVMLRGAVLGNPVVVHERFDAERLVAEGPDGAHVSLVPTMLRRLVEVGANLSRFGVLLVGGDAIDPDLAESAARSGGRVVGTYGLTETCGGVVYDGRLLDGSRVRFDGPKGEPEGEPMGGIELSGPTLMEGYRFDPAATGDSFTTDGWLRTGDAGHVSEDDLLRVDGRLDDMIRSGAEKVWPQEVERALRSHPKVGDVAVAGRPHPEWGQQVVAFVVPRVIDDPPTLKDMREHASELIAPYKAPRELMLVPELPRTASGKLHRSALPAS